MFKDAVGLLGDDRLEIRLGAVMTLGRLADEYPDFQGPVGGLLTAYLRERADQLADASRVTIEIVEIVKVIRRAGEEV